MVKPVLDIKAVEQHDIEIGPCTLMEHNEPPSLLVMVSDYPKGNMFSGLCLNTGMYTENDWFLDEFHIFKGEVTLRQGV
jgi:hypothetical protein